MQKFDKQQLQSHSKDSHKLETLHNRRTQLPAKDPVERYTALERAHLAARFEEPERWDGLS